MRESLAHALSGPISLAEDQWRERDVDRLHALAKAQVVNFKRTEREAHLARLGKSLIALGDAIRNDELTGAIDDLASCLAWTKPKPTEEASKKVAYWAIIEKVQSNCPVCKGKREIPDAERMAGRVFSDGDGAVPMRVCPECNGTGKHRYSNRERIEGLGINPADLHRYAKIISDAEHWISQAEAQALKSAGMILDKWAKK